MPKFENSNSGLTEKWFQFGALAAHIGGCLLGFFEGEVYVGYLFSFCQIFPTSHRKSPDNLRLSPANPWISQDQHCSMSLSRSTHYSMSLSIINTLLHESHKIDALLHEPLKINAMLMICNLHNLSIHESSCQHSRKCRLGHAVVRHVTNISKGLCARYQRCGWPSLRCCPWRFGNQPWNFLAKLIDHIPDGFRDLSQHGHDGMYTHHPGARSHCQIFLRLKLTTF